MGLFDRNLGKPPLPYSWIISGSLAIGPMPRDTTDWQQLELVGFRSRFSCCYISEEICAPPLQWAQATVSLPDHRRQEPLQPSRLQQALDEAEALVAAQPATYLHCMAGMERSPLMATGLLARHHKIDVFEALQRVRLCHPRAKPLYSDLEVLSQVLES